MHIKNLTDESLNLLHHLERFLNDYQKLEESTNQTALNEDDLYDFNMLYRIADKSHDIVKEIKQMNKPVLAEGYLEKNENGRYELNGYELTSGAPVEIWSEDDYYDVGGSWYSTRIEHNGEDYYAVGEKGSLNGKKARIK